MELVKEGTAPKRSRELAALLPKDTPVPPGPRSTRQQQQQPTGPGSSRPGERMKGVPYPRRGPSAKSHSPANHDEDNGVVAIVGDESDTTSSGGGAEEHALRGRDPATRGGKAGSSGRRPAVLGRSSEPPVVIVGDAPSTFEPLPMTADWVEVFEGREGHSDQDSEGTEEEDGSDRDPEEKEEEGKGKAGRRKGSSIRSLADLGLPKLSQAQIHEVLGKVPDKLAAFKRRLMSRHEAEFRLWRSQLAVGFSLLCYGWGSKRGLLELFDRRLAKAGHLTLQASGRRIWRRAACCTAVDPRPPDLPIHFGPEGLRNFAGLRLQEGPDSRVAAEACGWGPTPTAGRGGGNDGGTRPALRAAQARGAAAATAVHRPAQH